MKKKLDELEIIADQSAGAMHQIQSCKNLTEILLHRKS